MKYFTCYILIKISNSIIIRFHIGIWFLISKFIIENKVFVYICYHISALKHKNETFSKQYTTAPNKSETFFLNIQITECCDLIIILL